jgi:hypothetical protein
MPIAINSLTLSTIDPTTQKLAELEARLAKLESVLSVGASGEALLKSSTSVMIEAGTTLSMRAGQSAKIESSMSMSLKSSMTLDLQSAATMTLMGSLININ